VRTGDIYKGVLPFIAIQLFMLVILALWPATATWLPGVIFD
jgi:TRAP-type mannitol/chloroaromatic compound transport system permease large subunit